MYCAGCGRELEEDRNFCRFCGAPVRPERDGAGGAAGGGPVAGAAAGETAGDGLVTSDFDDPGADDLDDFRDLDDLTRPDEPDHRRATLWAFIAGVVVIVCVGIGLVLFFLLRDGSEGSGAGSSNVAVSTTAVSGATTASGGADGEGAAGGGTVTSVPTTQDEAGTTTTLPSGPAEPVDLSLQAVVTVSSTLEAQGTVDYGRENLLDRERTTCWAEGVSGYGLGEFVEFTFPSPVTVSEIHIIPGYDKVADGWDRWESNGRVRRFEVSFSDGSSETHMVDDARDLQVVALTTPHTITSARFTITAVYEAAEGPHKAEDTSVSELHLWGAG